MSLQQQLQALEERAHNIEADIRNSMSIGKLAGTGKSDAIIKHDDDRNVLNNFHYSYATDNLNNSQTYLS